MARRRRIVGVILASLLGCGGEDRALPAPYARITASANRVHVLCRGDYCGVQLMLGSNGDFAITVAADTEDHHHAERQVVVPDLRDVRIETGDGIDNIVAYGLAFSSLRNLTIASGGGDDGITLRFSSPPRALGIFTGDGHDTVDVDAAGGTSTTIDGGAGPDVLEVAYFGSGPVTVLGGDSEDTIVIAGFEPAAPLSVDAGPGNDRVVVDDLFAPLDARVDGGPGYDRLEAADPMLGPGFSAVGFEPDLI